MNAAFPVRQLSDLATSIDYGVTASASAVDNGTKFLRITDIQDGTVDWQTVPFCEATPAKLRSAQLSDGDIVFARTGATTGKSFLIQSPPDGAVFASYLIRVRPTRSVTPAYLAHFFQSKGYWRQIQRKTQGAAQGGVNATSLSEIEIPLPPLNEQRRIAAILDKADALRRKRKRALELLDSLAQSMFAEMFGNCFSETPNATLEDVAEIQVGFPFKSSEYTDQPDGIRLCRGANVLPNRVDWSDLAQWPEEREKEFLEYRLRPGDMVIAMDRPWISSGFKSARISSDDLPALLVQRVARLRPKVEAEADFLFALVRSTFFSIHFKPTETTVPHISPLEIRRFSFRRPAANARERFSAFSTTVTRMMKACTDDLVGIESLFSSLQHRAFSGRL